jgi:putative hydrolase of the HAD superfamily
MVAPDIDWNTIAFVAFDVDGTLYDQRRLRLRMAAEIGWHALARRSLATVRVLKIYRERREAHGEAETPDFEPRLLQDAASATGTTPQAVAALVEQWMLRRPLRHLAACRYAGVQELFTGLRRAGKTVGVLSDYPAQDKLAALGLAADHVVWAGQDGVQRLKPHPRGLEVLMAQAGATPDNTVLIGDRAERDGAVALRAGTQALILHRKLQPGFRTVASYADPLFAPVLA